MAGFSGYNQPSRIPRLGIAIIILLYFKQTDYAKNCSRVVRTTAYTRN